MTKRISDLQKVMLYRIFQEILMNTIKHSKASHLYVKIHYHKDGTVHLRIADNGIGFELNAKDFHPGVGLKSIQERAALLKAQLQITTRPRTGTYISLRCSGLLNLKTDKMRSEKERFTIY